MDDSAYLITQYLFSDKKTEPIFWESVACLLCYLFPNQHSKLCLNVFVPSVHMKRLCFSSQNWYKNIVTATYWGILCSLCPSQKSTPLTFCLMPLNNSTPNLCVQESCMHTSVRPSSYPSVHRHATYTVVGIDTWPFHTGCQLSRTVSAMSLGLCFWHNLCGRNERAG